jgi:DNA-binding transcriptional ArsR family regulator
MDGQINDDFRRLLWFLFGGSRGGENRARVVCALRSRPRNINQLAKLLDVDYRSVQHHIGVLLKNSLVVCSGQRYGTIFTIHPWLDHNFGTFDEICQKLGFFASVTDREVFAKGSEFENDQTRSQLLERITINTTG